MRLLSAGSTKIIVSSTRIELNTSAQRAEISLLIEEGQTIQSSPKTSCLKVPLEETRMCLGLLPAWAVCYPLDTGNARNCSSVLAMLTALWTISPCCVSTPLTTATCVVLKL